MKILKTMIFFSDAEPGKIFLYDTIEYDGKFWIVPEWLINRTLGKRRPARIIPLNQYRHQGPGTNSLKRIDIVNDLLTIGTAEDSKIQFLLLLQPNNILLRNPPGPSHLVSRYPFSPQTPVDGLWIDSEMFSQLIHGEEVFHLFTPLGASERFDTFIQRV